VDIIIFAAQTGHSQHEHICESIELFAKTVMPRFADRAESREAEKKARLEGAMHQAMARRPKPHRASRADYLVTAREEPGPLGALHVFPGRAAQSASGAAQGVGARAGKAIFTWLVTGRSDKQLERMMPMLVPMIFRAMERAFRPDRVFGFSGEIAYTLRTNGTAKNWVVRIAEGKATVKRGAAQNPRLALKMSAPTFARLSAGLIEPVTAVLEGKLEAEGELRLMNRISEMFGGPSGF
jgi:putative sterol carrier protein